LFAALVIPLRGSGRRRTQFDRILVAAIVYFVAIGLGFMFAEAAFMQQLTLLLGAPTRALLAVLTGLIFFAGLGSLASDRLAQHEECSNKGRNNAHAPACSRLLERLPLRISVRLAGRPDVTAALYHVSTATRKPTRCSCQS
jgi:hypothetical protein